jgi:hypothetical protein
LFALASFTALSGLVFTIGAAGCSSSDSGTTSDTDGGKDSGKPKPVPEAAPEEEAGPSTCPTEDPIDTSGYPWKSPFVSAGQCTETDLSSFVSYLGANDSAPYTDWKTKSGITPTCAACVFGPDGDTWHPLVEDSSGQLAELNVGGCIAIASGDDACGKAYQAFFDCRLEACSQCDDSGFANCNPYKGACKAANDAVLSVCGADKVAAAEDACTGDKYVFEGPIRFQCITGGDAGPDGG